MHSLPIRQQNYPQVLSISFRNVCPAANASILLDHFPNWVIDRTFNPLDADLRAIRTQSHRLEVLREFHNFQCISGRGKHNPL